jgi:UDP-N-acetylglucosamine--N-acetylmuramyl-(pentapeptide) pyrophosphoryl-undecaprenol N-acetylglucosamine transferase
MQLTEGLKQVQLCKMHSQQQRMPRVLIAGGGSGGHTAPAVAAAEALVKRGAEVLIAHSNRSIDLEMMKEYEYESIALPAAPLSTKPFGFFRFCHGFLQTSSKVKSLIRNQKIDCVLATGGFVAAPSLYGANKIGCHTVLLNLDNPAGKANKLAVRWADTVLSTVSCDLEGFKLVNPPLRRSVIKSAPTDICKQRLGLDPNKMTMLVTGASQGARTINCLIPELAKANSSRFNGWEILHIAGTTHQEEVEKMWKKVDVSSKVVGFLSSMGDAWGAADLAVTRGGANTVAEILINAVPTIVMPYPYHADDHQRTNAMPLEQLGGVAIAKDHKELKGNMQDAGERILQLLKDHKLRFDMQRAMFESPTENGSYAIADACLRF